VLCRLQRDQRTNTATIVSTNVHANHNSSISNNVITDTLPKPIDVIRITNRVT
jgi:hypothetical protein